MTVFNSEARFMEICLIFWFQTAWEDACVQQ